MASITEIQSGDLITDSRTDINNNFTNLNNDKIETSVLDTDTTLAANSDSKIATQRAVKAYVDSGGNQNASSSTRGIVELATTAEVTAGTDTGGTGAPLVVVPSEMNTQIDAKIAAAINYASGTTTHDISTTTTTTIAHGLGTTPTYVRVVATFGASSTFSFSEATYVDSTASAIYSALESGAAVEQGVGFRIYHDASLPNYLAGTVAANATNITITWSKTGSPVGTAPILWVAQK